MNQVPPEIESGDTYASLAAKLEDRIREHEEFRSREDFQAERTRLGRLTAGFVDAVRSLSFAYARDPESAQRLLQFSIDDFIESAVSVYMLGEQGVFNVGRRELRYMLEAAVKAVYVDQRLGGGASLEERLSYLSSNANVPRSSVDVVDQLTLVMLPDHKDFCAEVRSAFGALSGYTHISRKMLDERVRRISRGEYLGFESPATLRAFSALVAKTYDVVLALLLEGVGPMFAGDLFLHDLDGKENWPYAKTRRVSEISVTFDYKRDGSGRSVH